MTVKTRLGESGYGVRRYKPLGFTNKTQTAAPGISHPVGKLTRLGEGGYGVRRYKPLAFHGKTQSTAAPAAQRNHMFFVDVGNLM